MNTSSSLPPSLPPNTPRKGAWNEQSLIPPPLPQILDGYKEIQTTPPKSPFQHIRSFVLILCILLGAGGYYGDKTGYLYEYLPFIKKSWQTSPKQVETEEEHKLLDALGEGGNHRPCNLDAVKESLLPLKNVNIEDGNLTPLLISISKNDVKAVELLLQCKADPNLQTSRFTPLSIAVETKNPEIIRLLLEAGGKSPSSSLGYDHKPLVYVCIDLDFIDGLKLLLEHGFDPNEKLDKGDIINMTPLSYVLLNKHLHMKEIISLLFEQGAKGDALISAKNDEGIVETCDLLTWGIAMKVNPEMMRWFAKKALEYGADPKYINHETGITALHGAVLSEQYELAEILIRGGADPNACDKNVGYSPFSIVLQSRNVSAIKSLLELGANPNAKAAMGEGTEAMTPLCRLFTISGTSDEAAFEITEALLEKGADPNICTKENISPLWALVFKDDLTEETKIKCLNLLLQHKADINLHPPGKPDAFVTALCHKDQGEFLLAKALLDAGATINQKLAGKSLLGIACLYKHVKMVEFLINNGAAINIVDDDGKLPLCYAFPDKRSELNVSLACIDLLLKAGADKTNPVVLEEARKSPYREIRQLFIDEKDKEKGKNLFASEGSQKIHKSAILQDISSGNLDAGRKSIENIKAALKNAEESETVLLKDLSSVITDLYSIRKMEEAVRKQNTRDEKKITSLVVWERSCMTPNRLTGDTNPSGAARARRDAQLLSNTIRQRNETLTEKQKEIADIAKRIEEQLRKNGREKDADMLKKSTRYFLKINGVSTRDPFDSI